jgi:hypothetical protein
MMSIEIEATGDRQAFETALKLKGLVKDSPMLQMALQGAGIQVSGDPVVHQPQRAVG